MIQDLKKLNILRRIYDFNFEWTYTLLLIFVTICSLFVNQIYKNKLPRLERLQNLHNKIIQLRNNDIVKNHVLNNLKFKITSTGRDRRCTDSEQFVQYVEKNFDKKYGKITDIKVSNHTRFSVVNVTQIEILNMFIHDKFIFEYIDKIHLYNGFARVSALKIEKKQLDNGKNVLTTRIICDLYSK